MNVAVTGEPPPKVTWTFGGKQVDATDRVKIDNPDYMTKFSVKRTLRGDTGTYTITAVNDSGQDTAELEVVVLGNKMVILFENILYLTLINLKNHRSP